MAYGIKLFYYSISIDTEVMLGNGEGQLYSWLSIGRFGLILTKKLLGLMPFNAYVANFFMLCTMLIFSLFLGFLFRFLRFEPNKKSKFEFIFSCVFITSPIFAEQFNFALQGFEVALASFFVSVAAFLVTKWVLDSKNVIHLILGTFLMVWGFASYQAVVFLYISIILSCYYFIYVSKIKNKIILQDEFFKTAVIKYLLTFFCAYLLYFVVNKIIVLALGIKSSSYLSKMILWSKLNFWVCVRSVIGYMLRGKIYICCSIIFIIFSVINLFSKNKDKILFIISSIFLVLSPFFLAFFLGQGLIARSQFSVQFITALALYFLLCQIDDKRRLKNLVIFLSLCLTFVQSYKVSCYMYTDYMKYQSEVFLANKISTKIDALNLGTIPEYPVVFVGKIHPINTPVELRGEVIGSSFFEWDNETDFGSNFRILGFMKSIGYPYKVPNQSEIDRGKKISRAMPVWPNNGAIKFTDNLIVVRLS